MIRRALLTLGVVASTAIPASAQVLGVPVMNNGTSTGINLGVDVGFANEAYGKGTAVGGRASLGLGFFGVTAMVSHFSPSDNSPSVWAPGASATLRLLGGPLVPFRINMQAGVSRWNFGELHTTHVPISIGIAATIPNPAFAIKPWIAPRLDVSRSTGGTIEGGSVTSTSARFGISGGIDLALLNGLSIRAAYDRLSASDSHPSIFSLGLGFAP